MPMVHVSSILFNAEAESTLTINYWHSSSQADGACSGLNGDLKK